MIRTEKELDEMLKKANAKIKRYCRKYNIRYDYKETFEPCIV